MKFIKSLLLSSIILLSGCMFNKHKRAFHKYNQVNKSGLSVISKDCPELRRMIKEGQMHISKNCDFDCHVYFEKELYEYSVIEAETFFSNLCVKTKAEIDVLFGFETNVFPWRDSTKLVLLQIYNTIPKEDFISGTNGYILNVRDSVTFR